MRNKENDNKARREFVERYKEILKERFSFKYKYEYLKKLPSKMSISKLYPEILDGNENSDIEIKPLKDKPKFLLTENEKSSAAEIGTATHAFMQFCNFKELEKENGVKNELDRLINESFISEHDGKLVSIDKLELFKKSSLFEEILKSKRVIREFRFNVLIEAENLTSYDDLKKEKVLLQGVTDCIFETEDGKLTLVDYKTDDVPEDGYEDVLKEKHSIQLNYYRKACNKIFDNLVNRSAYDHIQTSQSKDQANQIFVILWLIFNLKILGYQTVTTSSHIKVSKDILYFNMFFYFCQGFLKILCNF